MAPGWEDQQLLKSKTRPQGRLHVCIHVRVHVSMRVCILYTPRND